MGEVEVVDIVDEDVDVVGIIHIIIRAVTIVPIIRIKAVAVDLDHVDVEEEVWKWIIILIMHRIINRSSKEINIEELKMQISQMQILEIKMLNQILHNK